MANGKLRMKSTGEKARMDCGLAEKQARQEVSHKEEGHFPHR